MSDDIRIFISHSSKEKDLVDAFVDLLTSGLNINSDEIFCTSLEGLGIPTGEGFIDFIKAQIEEADVVISIVSKNYYDSAFCLCELGASWVISGDHMPILVPPMEFSDIEDVMKGLQGRKINSGSDLSEIKDELEALLALKPMKTARWNVKKDKFLKEVEEIIPTLPVPETVTFEEHAELKEKYDESLKVIEEIEAEKDEKDEIIKDLKSCKDREEVSAVVKKYSDLDEEFESLIGEAKNAIKKLDNIIIEALYYYYRDEDFPLPERIDTYQNDVIKTAIEEDFLSGHLGNDSEYGSVSVNENDPRIQTAIEALNSLQSFVFRVTDDCLSDHEDEYREFEEDYIEEKGFNLKFETRNFWREHLDM